MGIRFPAARSEGGYGPDVRLRAARRLHLRDGRNNRAQIRLDGRAISMIRYIELKSGYHDDGPEWIARVAVSKSGRTLYFNGMALKRSTQLASGNYYDIETSDSYWVSGVKKGAAIVIGLAAEKSPSMPEPLTNTCKSRARLSWTRQHSSFQQRSGRRTSRNFTIWRTCGWHHPMAQFDQSEPCEHRRLAAVRQMSDRNQAQRR
jgi:hypothetical protein